MKNKRLEDFDKKVNTTEQDIIDNINFFFRVSNIVFIIMVVFSLLGVVCSFCIMFNVNLPAGIFCLLVSILACVSSFILPNLLEWKANILFINYRNGIMTEFKEK